MHQHGSPLETVLRYSPRQMFTLAGLVDERLSSFYAQDLYINTLASRGKKEEVNKRLKQWHRD